MLQTGRVPGFSFLITGVRGGPYHGRTTLFVCFNLGPEEYEAMWFRQKDPRQVSNRNEDFPAGKFTGLCFGVVPDAWLYHTLKYPEALQRSVFKISYFLYY